MIKPGHVHRSMDSPFPAGNVFEKLQRLPADISSSESRRFHARPDTGAAVGQNRLEISAETTIYVDVEHLAIVGLPIMPKGRRRRLT